jgi:phosphatidate cytidylyltransferase
MRSRLITALVGIPLAVAAVLWPGGLTPFPGWPLAVVVLVLIPLGLREFYDGCRKAGLLPRDPYGYVAALLFLVLATPLVPADQEFRILSLGLTVLVMLSLVTEALRADRAPLKSLAPTWLSIVYVAWLFPFVLRLRLPPPAAIRDLGWSLPQEWMAACGEGAWLLLFTWVVTMAVDSGAYFAGKSLGKHKLAPVLSPGKTWEGAVGGFLAALLIGGLLGVWLRLPTSFALVASALAGVLAQFGDLSKSAIKREIGIKDFGTLIPGHGGVLDRCDSLLFTAPTVYWLLLLWPGGR